MIPWTNGSAGRYPSATPDKAGWCRWGGHAPYLGAAKCGDFFLHSTGTTIRTLCVFFRGANFLQGRKILVTLHAGILIYRHLNPPLFHL